MNRIKIEHILYKRSNSSLVTLTQQFVSILRGSKTGVIDLKWAAQLLGVQKRRIYDITNVLEGIGLISKTCKSSCVKWSGSEEANEEYDEKVIECILEDLEKQRIQLKLEEEDLDRHLRCAKQNINTIKSCTVTKSFAYVTRDDLIHAFGDSVILTVQNYKKYDTPLLYLDDRIVSDRFLCATAETGSMVDVRLVTNDGESHVPSEEVEEIESLIQSVNYPTDEAASSNDSEQTDGGDGRIRGRKRPVARNKTTHKAKIKRLADNHEQEENKITAKILLHNDKFDRSLRRYFPNDVETSETNTPLVQINPPKNDFLFVLGKDEGLCDLFDLDC